MNIQDVYDYFNGIDSINPNGIIDKQEFKLAKKENSIFSSILEKNMTIDDYSLKFVRTYRDQFDDLSSNDGIYKMEQMPKPQSWSWDKIDRVFTKD